MKVLFDQLNDARSRLASLTLNGLGKKGDAPFNASQYKANINALEKAGLRDSVVVMVGGAPVTQEYADVVGADGYAADASATVKRAKELLQNRRSTVLA